MHTRCSGCTEEDKAVELTRKLGVQVHRSMVVLSHSPMRCLAAEYSEKRVMVLGSSAKQIAEEDLGVRDTVSTWDTIQSACSLCGVACVRSMQGTSGPRRSKRTCARQLHVPE